MTTLMTTPESATTEASTIISATTITSEATTILSTTVATSATTDYTTSEEATTQWTSNTQIANETTATPAGKSCHCSPIDVIWSPSFCSEKLDNTGLILGLSLGLGIPALLILVGAIVCCVRKGKNNPSYGFSNEGSPLKPVPAEPNNNSMPRRFQF